MEKDAPYLLKENGGPIDPHSRSLRQSWCRRHSFVKRRKTSSRKGLSEQEVEEKKSAFCEDVNQKIRDNDILDGLIINFDETGLPVLPTDSYTLEVRGATTVKIAGVDDKRAVTGVVAGCRDGTKLPWQLIYTGKTDRCHPDRALFPTDWSITHSKSHWSTNETKNKYVAEVIVKWA